MDRKQLEEDLQNLPIETICTKYNLTFKELFKVARTLYTYIDAEDTDSYINQTRGGNWTVNKFIGDETIYFGTYKSKRDAIIVRNELIDVNWDIKRLDEILKELDIERIIG